MSKRHLFLLIIFLAYIALVIFGIYHHEPWRDEAHGWMMAREKSIQTLINEVKYVGTPVLWKVVLIPFAKSGLPYFWMGIVHVTFAIISVWLFLFFARIPTLTKILFVFSYYISYEYAVIARYYVLTIALLFIIATIYSQRFIKPFLYAILIFFLFQTNTLSLGIASGLVLIYCIELLKERKINLKTIAAMGVMLAGALFVFLTLYNPYGPAKSFTLQPVNTWLEIPIVIRHSIVPEFWQTDTFILLKLSQINSFILILSTFTLILFIVKIWENKYILLLAFITYGWFFYVTTFVHFGFLRHHGLLLIFVIFLWWISRTQEKKALYQVVLKTIFTASINILLFISIIYTINIYYQDYKFNFSGAKDMVSFIKSHGLENVNTVIYEGGLGEAILPYFSNNQFWYPEFERSGYFEMSDKRYHMRLDEIKYSGGVLKVIEKVHNNFRSQSPLLLMLTTPLPDTESKNYTLLHVSSSKYFWVIETENFWLYQRI